MFGLKERVVAPADGLQEFDIPLTDRVFLPLIYGQSAKRWDNKGN